MKKSYFAFLCMSLFVGLAQFYPSHGDSEGELPCIPLGGSQDEFHRAFINAWEESKERERQYGELEEELVLLREGIDLLQTPRSSTLTPNSDFSIGPRVEPMPRPSPSLLSASFSPEQQNLEDEILNFHMQYDNLEDVFDDFKNLVERVIYATMQYNNYECEQQFYNCLRKISFLSDPKLDLINAQIYWNTFIKRSWPDLKILAEINQQFIRSFLAWLIQQDPASLNIW